MDDTSKNNRYYLTDYLSAYRSSTYGKPSEDKFSIGKGSTWAVVDDSGTVLESFDYYPFGLLMPKRNTAGAGTIEKFTDKERDEVIGLDYFGARYLDPALGRWLSRDPLIEITSPKEYLYHSVSPYNYVLNNPSRYIDPNGLWVLTLQLQIRGQYYVSGSGAFGIAYDDKGGLGIFGTVGLGGGAGKGVTGGFEGSYYHTMNSIDDLSGWGGLFGGTAFFGNVGVGFELNYSTNFFTTGGDVRDAGLSITPPFANIGAHAGIFGEASYTWLTKTSDWKSLSNILVSDYGFSKAGAKEFVALAQQAFEEVKAKIEDFEKKFRSGDIQNLEEGTYTWNGEEWVREEEND